MEGARQYTQSKATEYISENGSHLPPHICLQYSLNHSNIKEQSLFFFLLDPGKAFSKDNVEQMILCGSEPKSYMPCGACLCTS